MRRRSCGPLLPDHAAADEGILDVPRYHAATGGAFDRQRRQKPPWMRRPMTSRNREGYLGGTNSSKLGLRSQFAIHLAPGEYVWAASYYQLSGEGDEIMKLVPLTVTGEATPEAGTPATAEATPAGGPVADVRLEMTDDLVYMVSPDPLSTGPQIWNVTNTGTEQSHHLVMQRVPEGTTAEQILAEFGGMMAGTPRRRTRSPRPSSATRRCSRAGFRLPGIRSRSGDVCGDLLHHRPGDRDAARDGRHGDGFHGRVAVGSVFGVRGRGGPLSAPVSVPAAKSSLVACLRM